MTTYGVDVAMQLGTTLLIEADSQEQANEVAGQMSPGNLEDAIMGAHTAWDYCLVRAVSSQYERLDEPLGRLREGADTDDLGREEWATLFVEESDEDGR